MRLILSTILCCMVCCVSAQQVHFGKKATIYLVRHAEKDTGDNPALTRAGNKRAGDLMRLLKSKYIARIYVTGLRRTQQTADSLRLQCGIDTVQYLADTCCTYTDLLKKIKAHHDQYKTLLVIGHSNTVPLLVRKLCSSTDPKGLLPDNEFDNLFVVTFKNGKASFKKRKYGVPSALAKPVK